MDSRDLILDRVRRNAPAPVALPELPAFERPAGPLIPVFTAALARMGGAAVELDVPEAIADWLQVRFENPRIVVSATPELAGTRALDPAASPAALEDVDVGVVRAAFGVGETGSVWLSEREYGVNALGFLPQHLVVLLDPAAIVPDLHAAYRDPRFRTARYAVLMTGPSATADIEGVLIRGAQGVRSLTVILSAAPS